jgi:hypothetical protein
MKTNGRESAWPFVVGVSLASLGILLIGLGGGDAQMRTFLYVSGGLLLLCGMFLIWFDLCKLPTAWGEPTLKCEGTYLGSFRLNNYLLEAYEMKANTKGAQFRLVASPSLNPAREAAFVRYMVQEGFIESMWPQMAKQIKDESKWAFFRYGDGDGGKAREVL